MDRSTLTALVMGGVAVASLLSATPATATFRDSSAGGGCHAAAGGAAASFTYGNNYITNTGTTTQYVICHFEMEDAGVTPTATIYLTVHTSSTQAGRTVLCSAQTGGYYFGANHVTSSNARSYTFADPGYAQLTWDSSLVNRPNPFDTFTINCRLDPGTRVGLIEYQDD